MSIDVVENELQNRVYLYQGADIYSVENVNTIIGAIWSP